MTSVRKSLAKSSSGDGAAAGSRPVTCETCRGQGEVAHVQRSFLGEIRTLRLAACYQLLATARDVEHAVVIAHGDRCSRSRESSRKLASNNRERALARAEAG